MPGSAFSSRDAGALTIEFPEVMKGILYTNLAAYNGKYLYELFVYKVIDEP